jgi:hypothetical protein
MVDVSHGPARPARAKGAVLGMVGFISSSVFRTNSLLSPPNETMKKGLDQVEINQ